MRAVAISQPGPADVLQIAEHPVPAFKAGELLIKVHAAGINRPDVLQRLGKYAPPAGASDLPGLEVAGEVVDGDFANTGFSKGDLVCALVQGGGYAEYCAAPAGQCLPLPKGLTALQGASLPENFFTVWSNVFDRCALADGETLLVQGGTSGIGVAAIQLAAALGHRVFATAGSDDKARACEALGAERGINYRTEDFVAVVKELTGGRGVDVILDMVGGDYLPREIDCLADDGRIGLIAVQGGTKAELDLGSLLRRRLTVTGSTLRPRSVAFKAAIANHLRTTVWPLIEAGKIKPVIYKTFPLEKANEAHALMEASTHVGKIMLQVA
ncbi:NAD(P)H-quinone oxidoreductase [Janthinobacterium violaceinigrum]|uniref:Zinc-binding dehydrogenase n=1 Tax=Janthinobacterium violaceinigrum TaxID=2654252 RepID=A0A6I1HZN0_9BURK|nr:NAD(P)H-quinone oxidoreductase [Janthinobacterium violaceinigrum]KAB8064164.1 zinc-binding dehydrogenase [Janthinobacterium violaceinigrum]